MPHLESRIPRMCRTFLSVVCDLVACSAVVVAALPWILPHFRSGKPQVLYVSPAGSDWNRGNSLRKALRSIQRAVDAARPGDRIVVQPGKYRERLHIRRGGLPGRPIVIEAADPGTVSISWSADVNRELVWSWHVEGDGIYSTVTRWPVCRASADGETLFCVPWGGLNELRTLAKRDGAWGAFCNDGTKLCVYLRNARHPTDARLIVNRPVPPPREWGEFKSANVWVEADWIELRGLRLEFGIGAGVLLWNAENVTVTDCAFSEATFGIKAGCGIKPARNLRIERCLYHNYPQHQWRESWLSWNEVYAAYSSSTLVYAIDDGTTVKDCVVAHFGDALRLTTRDQPMQHGLVAEGNWLAFGTDDAIEFDGSARHVRFRDNLVLDCHESLGVSPVSQGPVTIQGNLFLHPRTKLNGAQVKLLSPRLPIGIRNVEIRRNVFYGNWLCWWNETPVSDVHVHDNLFAVRSQKSPPWPKGVIESSNLYWSIAPQEDELQDVNSVVLWLQDRVGETDHRQVLNETLAHARRRPGPSWWDYRKHPATRPLAELANVEVGQ